MVLGGAGGKRLFGITRRVMRIVAVASEPMEFPGILARAQEIRAMDVGADWARLARFGPQEWLLVANGAGARRAGAALDAILPGFAADVLVSTGFCGAVTPELGVGEIIVATEVVGETACFPAERFSASPPHYSGVVRTIDRIAQTAKEKRKWRDTGASAVEMEAAAVGERAVRYGLPFYCVKAVTDEAGENLANDLNRALRPDGHFDTIVVLGSVLRRPMVRLPELVRLRKRSVRAARALGDFFANCRF